MLYSCCLNRKKLLESSVLLQGSLWCQNKNSNRIRAGCFDIENTAVEILPWPPLPTKSWKVASCSMAMSSSFEWNRLTWADSVEFFSCINWSCYDYLWSFADLRWVRRFTSLLLPKMKSANFKLVFFGKWSNERLGDFGLIHRTESSTAQINSLLRW